MTIKYNHNKIIKKHKYNCLVKKYQIKTRKKVLINFTLWPEECAYNQRCFFYLHSSVGYIKLNSYLNKIGFNSSNLCDTCQQEETVEHFLLHCKQNDTYRQTMFDKGH
jgi:hypothetical protein